MEAEDYPAAADAFLRGSMAIGKLAKVTENEKLREKRLTLAKNYMQVGKELKKGIIPVKSKPKEYKRSKEVHGSTIGTEPGEEEGFEKYVEQNLIATSRMTWENIGGLNSVKETIKESVVLSIIEEKPEAIKPWKGILLFGPPGTGKTLLAAATAGSLEATFFNVKVGQILSKYFGESSKLVSALYSVGRKKSPSIVFLDEFDSIALSRSGEVAESSRRVLSTLLSELDGLQDKDSGRYVLTMAATNTPWDIDSAVLSRFPKRIHIPLPDKEACLEIIRIHTIKEGLKLDEQILDEIAVRCTENLFAGRDIATLCNDAIWNMVRSENPALGSLADKPVDAIQEYRLGVRELTAGDFEKSFESVRSAVKARDVARYDKWAEEYGSG
ncbi:MAG: AAA family ATPase [Methanosarcinales archaeon]|uniref:AAA family ATPase n=1 Tax=Candidatus Ethanoperedens thermophilum TaxID=2766897 RepID=A0A848D7Z6_9EURY|nr:AAA family ATPase [Candidatus Ethanoperedens thermophilum]